MNGSCKPILRMGLAIWLGAPAAVFGREENDKGSPEAPAQEREPTLAEKRAWRGAKVYEEVCDHCHKMGVDGARFAVRNCNRAAASCRVRTIRSSRRR